MDFAIKNSWPVKLKPLEVDSKIGDDLYFIVFSVHNETGLTGTGTMAGSAGYA
jgi:hypothetical protein